MAIDFQQLYTDIGTWTQQPSATTQNKSAAVYANYDLSYGLQLPVLRPWWRKREDVITPVAGTQSYALPTASGTVDSLHKVWYRTSGERQPIEVVDDDVWHQEADEDTSQTGTPEICNLFNDGGTVKLRFSPTPSGSWISSLTSTEIHLDSFIRETMDTSSGDAVEPLMPESRRPGIVWRGVELIAAYQGDTNLLQWAFAQGKRYYELIIGDDVGRVGDKQRIIRPVQTLQGVNNLTDYGHRRYGS